MVVDLHIKCSKAVKKGDVLMANDQGVFEVVSKNDLLKDTEKEITELKRQNERLQTIIKGMSEKIAKVLKGVID